MSFSVLAIAAVLCVCVLSEGRVCECANSALRLARASSSNFLLQELPTRNFTVLGKTAGLQVGLEISVFFHWRIKTDINCNLRCTTIACNTSVRARREGFAMNWCCNAQEVLKSEVGRGKNSLLHFIDMLSF
jgi:hypothetical protein